MKRLFDLTVSISLLLLLSPIFVLLYLAGWRNLGRPVLFRQMRAGKRGVPFRLYKFRTMSETRSEDGERLPDSERLTRYGKWLRTSSLDELPSLINVVKGEMSLVGPRPLLPEYRPLYNERQRRRHEVLPGMTGWAQVNGRNLTDWPERFEQDVWYVENRTFLLDLSILCRTFLVTLRREGVQAEGHVTMPPFRGESESTDS